MNRMNSPIEEKYLCEIYYAVERNGYARISELAKFLNVSASSVSRMATRLNESKLIDFERYGDYHLDKKRIIRRKKISQKA